MVSARVHGGPDARGAVPHDFSTNANAVGPCPQALAAVQAADDLLAMIDDAMAPLVERHEAELAELEERVAQLGERGSGRKELVERQNREQRRYRADELRFGLTTLARRCRDELATSARPANVIDALAAIQRVSEGLIRNPNERLQLQALFVEIGALGI